MVTTTAGSARHIANTRVPDMRVTVFTKLSLLMALCCQFALLPQAQAVEVTQAFKSGKYEGLMLAADHDGNLSGYYSETQGEGVTKTCTFFLKGKIAENRAENRVEVATWSDQVFPGVLKTVGTDVSLQIEKGREFPGCGLVLMPEIARGITLDKTFEAKWDDLKIVVNDRAYLFSEPSESKKMKSYLIKNDVVGILSRNGEWVRIEFPRDGKKSIGGWVKASDVKEFSAPQN